MAPLRGSLGFPPSRVTPQPLPSWEKPCRGLSCLLAGEIWG